MTPAEVLRKAADLLVERGWAQGRLQHRNGRLCATGAVSLADTGLLGVTGPVGIAAWRGIPREVGGAWVTTWNDQVSQTAENVIATMRRVADDLDAQVPA